MNNRPARVMVILLVMSVMLGNVPFRDMLVCVHEGGGESAVHLHYGQLPGQSCDEPQAGFRHVAGDNGPRHFSLDLETFRNKKTSVKRVLNLLLPVQPHPSCSAAHWTGGRKGAVLFEDPSFLSLDTAFTHTTILII